MGHLEAEAVELQYFDFDTQIEDFETLVSNIERRSETSAVSSLRIVCSTFDLDTVQHEIDRIVAHVSSDPEDAITASCSLVESVCRSILCALDLPLPKELSVAPLYKAVRKPLGLDADSFNHNEEQLVADVRSVLAGVTNCINALGALRSHSGDAHGKEKGTKRVDARISRLAANLSSSVALFLVETWQYKHPQLPLVFAATGKQASGK